MSIPLIIIISLVIGFLIGAAIGTKKQPPSSVSEAPAKENATEVVPPINPQQQKENEALKAKISALEQTLEQERTHAATYRQEMQAYLKTVNSAVDNLCAAVDNIRHTVTTNPTGFAQSAAQTVPQAAGDKDTFTENAPVDKTQSIVNKEKEENTQAEGSSRADDAPAPAMPEQDEEKTAAPPVDNFVDNSDLSLRGESPQESIKRHLDQSKHQ